MSGYTKSWHADIGALINVGEAPGTELFTVPEQIGKSYSAQVQSMAQAIGTGSGAMLIQMIADNSNREWIAGGHAQASVERSQPRGRLTIPSDALMMGKEGPRVAMVDANNKVMIQKVQIARDSEAVIELAAGVSPTDRIIQSPPDGVSAGDVVKVALPVAASAR